GRGSGNQVVVPDLLVSRQHAEMARTSAGWHLTDLGSRNGTFVDGRRVDDAEVTPGQRVTVGQTDFMVTGSGLEPRPIELLPSLEAARLTVRLRPDLQLLSRVTFSMPSNT